MPRTLSNDVHIAAHLRAHAQPEAVITVMREWMTALPWAGLISTLAVVVSKLVKQLPWIIHASAFRTLAKEMAKRKWDADAFRQVIALMREIDRNATDREIAKGPEDENERAANLPPDSPIQ